MIKSIKNMSDEKMFPIFVKLPVGSTFIVEGRLYIKVKPVEDTDSNKVYNTFCFDYAGLMKVSDDFKIRNPVDVCVTFECKD